MSDATGTITNRAGLAGLVGSALGHSRSIVVDQETITGFARLTHDEQWIHTDPERAATGPFGATVAHGFLTLSLCAPFVTDLLEVSDASMTVNYGLDRVRFPTPVVAGSSVRAEGSLASLSERDGYSQGVVELVIQAKGAEKPCCVAAMVVRWYE